MVLQSSGQAPAWSHIQVVVQTWKCLWATAPSSMLSAKWCPMQPHTSRSTPLPSMWNSAQLTVPVVYCKAELRVCTSSSLPDYWWSRCNGSVGWIQPAGWMFDTPDIDVYSKEAQDRPEPDQSKFIVESQWTFARGLFVEYSQLKSLSTFNKTCIYSPSGSP